MGNWSWEMIGAIFGILSFFLSLIVEWERLSRTRIRQILTALLIGIIVFIIIALSPRVINFINEMKGADDNPTQAATLSPPTTEKSTQEIEILENNGVLFEENFEDGEANGMIYVFGDWEVKSFDGNLIYEIDNSNGTEYPSFDFGSTSWENYSVSYRVRMLNLISHAPEVIFEFRKSANAKDRYIQSFITGYDVVIFAISKHGNPWQNLETSGTYTFNQNQWYSVKVNVFEDNVKIYVNDVLLINATDTQLTNGRLQLSAGPGSIVQFDDIIVMSLDK